MKEKGYRLVRYADDFLIMCDTLEQAESAHLDAAKFLNDELGLKIHPIDNKIRNSKTKIVRPEKEEFSFLSVEFDGKNIFPKREKISNLKKRIRYSLFKYRHEPEKLLQSIKDLTNRLISIYSYTDIQRYFAEIDSFIDRQVFKFLFKRDLISDNNTGLLTLEDRQKFQVLRCQDILGKKTQQQNA